MTPIPFQTAEPAPLPRPALGPVGSVIARGDPRWLLAARAHLLMIGHPRLASHHRERLMQSASRIGFPPIHAAAILAIAEQASLRGGLDHNAAQQLAAIPAPTRPRQRNVACYLNITVALLVCVAAAIAVLRFA